MEEKNVLMGCRIVFIYCVFVFVMHLFKHYKGKRKQVLYNRKQKRNIQQKSYEGMDNMMNVPWMDKKTYNGALSACQEAVDNGSFLTESPCNDSSNVGSYSEWSLVYG